MYVCDFMFTHLNMQMIVIEMTIYEIEGRGMQKLDTMQIIAFLFELVVQWANDLW